MPIPTLFRFPISLLFIAFCRLLIAQNEQFTVTPLGPDNFLSTPWEMLYGPDDYLWLTERERGSVVRVDPETGAKDELVQIEEVYTDGRQDGLLGLALHQELMQDSAFVYVSYTYFTEERRQKLVRYTYQVENNNASLVDPVTLIENMPASNDHNSGRLVFGADGKLYYTIGDQGGNQNRNYCNPILSQVLPTQEEIDANNWQHYPGKTLRLNTDGSIPTDNPILNGVQSHIYSYGHRNAQGLVFGKNGLLYSDEHGPNTDDEVNIIYAGKNYGWPNVAGFRDDQAYDYCNWSSANNCADLEYENGTCPEGAAFSEESELTVDNYQEPIASMFAVTDDYDYNNPACENAWVCRPNVAPSSLDIYESEAIPGWTNSLLVVSLKRGRIYRYPLNEDGTAIQGDTTEHFYTHNRYRDMAIDPDGKTFYLLTDYAGRLSTQSGLGLITNLDNPGTILKFTLAEPVSTNDTKPIQPFKISPNPVQHSFLIETQQTDARAELINVAGQIVRRIPTIATGSQRVKVTDLPAGVYFLKFYSAQYSWVERAVIK